MATHDVVDHLDLLSDDGAVAGQIAMSLTRMARELEMRSVVADGRERYATPERFPDADEIRVGMPSDIVGEIVPNPRVAVLLVAHDYEYDSQKIT